MSNYVKITGGGGKKADGTYNDKNWNFTEQLELEGVYFLRKDDVGQFKKSIYKIRDAQGGEWTVWGTKLLDGAFAQVPLNSKVKLVYLGKHSNKGGTGKYHNFDVFVDSPASTTQPVVKAATTEKSNDDVPF